MPRTFSASYTPLRISWPMTCVLMAACREWGYSLEIKGRTGSGKTANYAIEIDNVRIDAAQASKLIGQFKANR